MSKSVAFIFVLVVAAIAVQPIQATYILNSQGNIVYQSDGRVLGDDDTDEKEEENDSEDDNSGKSNDREEEKEDSEDHDEDEKEDESEDHEEQKENEFSSESYDPKTGTKVKTEIRGDETRVEVKYKDGREYKYELNDDPEDKREESYEYKNKNQEKLKLEYRDGKLVIKSENSFGDDLEIGEDDVFEIEADENEDRIRIASDSGRSLLFAKGKHAAKTNFPLSIDSETNELIVSTPSGEKVVTILPNAAIANMLAQNAFDRLSDDEVEEGTESAQLEDLEGVVELAEDDDGELVYEIDGISEQKLFGIAPVEIKRKVKVSAQTGERLGTQMSFFERLKDIFSF